MERLLNKFARPMCLATKADAGGFIESFLERNSPLFYRSPDQPFNIRIQSDCSPHAAIIAATVLLS